MSAEQTSRLWEMARVYVLEAVVVITHFPGIEELHEVYIDHVRKLARATAESLADPEVWAHHRAWEKALDAGDSDSARGYFWTFARTFALSPGDASPVPESVWTDIDHYNTWSLDEWGVLTRDPDES